MFLLFQKYLNPQVRTNKLVNSVVHHLCSSRLASEIHTYLFKLLRVLSLSEMLVEFCLTCIFHHVWEKFMVIKLENALNLCIFIHTPVLHLKLKILIFQNLFSPTAKNKNVKKTMICIIKICQKIWKWLETLVYLYFLWFIIFLNVMALLSCE